MHSIELETEPPHRIFMGFWKALMKICDLTSLKSPYLDVREMLF